ncbi:MAG TPA: hypothetical protein PLZ86_01465 [bacterium]|nr:hypothetical protein [bacterium]
MRSWKLEKNPGKREGREQSQAGWNKNGKGYGQARTSGRDSQKKIAMGIGFHLPRTLGGHH